MRYYRTRTEQVGQNEWRGLLRLTRGLQLTRGRNVVLSLSVAKAQTVSMVLKCSSVNVFTNVFICIIINNFQGFVNFVCSFGYGIST